MEFNIMHQWSTNRDSRVQISDAAWQNLLELKYGSLQDAGWGPRMRARFAYRTPDDWYEAFLLECVSSDTSWLDVGCGRFLFPSNGRTAALLASRCKLLVGLDPGNNIDDNPYVHERVKAQIEDYHDSREFDLITLRMVAEHITDPENTLNSLARLAKPGGRVVIYTVSKWSPASLAAAATPMAAHHAAKRFLWKTETRDTFPTAYRLNTRKALSTLFARAGFTEQSFEYIDDCRSLQRWRAGALMELSVWRLLRAIGLPYPERCILAAYVRNSR